MTTSTLHHAHRTSTVLADDGTPLVVHEYGPRSAPLTVVFVHGHCLRAAAWHYQVRDLHRRWGSGVRLISYDQRGHGESGHTDIDHYTVEQLGCDLAAVLRSTHADRVVIVGHSMGGMAALAHIRLNPAAAGTRIAGMALIATSAGDLAAHGLGRSLNNPALTLARLLVHRAPVAAGTLRLAGQHMARPLIHGFGYGLRTSPRLRTLGTAMLAEVHLATMVGYLTSLKKHDEKAALAHLQTIPVSVICGTADLMTPVVHSEAIAAALPDAELSLIDGAGHMVIHERPTQVSHLLSDLVRSVLVAAPRASGRIAAHA